jgi:hypothetical protein
LNYLASNLDPPDLCLLTSHWCLVPSYMLLLVVQFLSSNTDWLTYLTKLCQVPPTCRVPMPLFFLLPSILAFSALGISSMFLAHHIVYILWELPLIFQP